MKDPIRCTDACGRSVADDDEASLLGWSRLQITGRLRCPQCVRDLDAANLAPEANAQPTGERGVA